MTTSKAITCIVARSAKSKLKYVDEIDLGGFGYGYETQWVKIKIIKLLAFASKHNVRSNEEFESLKKVEQNLWFDRSNLQISIFDQ